MNDHFSHHSSGRPSRKIYREGVVIVSSVSEETLSSSMVSEKVMPDGHCDIILFRRTSVHCGSDTHTYTHTPQTHLGPLRAPSTLTRCMNCMLSFFDHSRIQLPDLRVKSGTDQARCSVLALQPLALGTLGCREEDLL